MNLYLEAIGFSDMDSKKEKKFLQTGLKQCLDSGCFLKNDVFKRGVVIMRISNSTGLYLFGRFEGKKFIYEFYYPFVIGKKITENDEITIERHVDKESYSVICDEKKTGVTLIFYLQNIFDYLDYIAKKPGFDKKDFNPDKRNSVSKIAITGAKTVMSALSLGGTILLPIDKQKKTPKSIEAENKRRRLIAAAKNGDEEAMESLTIDEIDTYTKISNRIIYEDVFSIVDSTFMPCGVECDQYSVVGEILELDKEENIYTGEKIFIMTLDCNGMIFTMAVREDSLMGEPKVGRRFKGQVWLQGTVYFDN